MAHENPALTRHVSDLWPDLERLLRVGDQAQQLLAQPGWAAIDLLVDAEIDAINAQMERTTPLSRADYAVRHGRIGGLKAAREAAEAIVAIADERRSEQQAKHEGEGSQSSPER